MDVGVKLINTTTNNDARKMLLALYGLCQKKERKISGAINKDFIT